jgi:hypothetical protein
MYPIFDTSFSSFLDKRNEYDWMNITRMHFSSVINVGTPDYVSCCVFGSAVGYIFFPMAQQPLLGQGLLIIEPSRSHEH